jgi:hypothetical protein
LNKLLDSALLPALSGTEVALTSKLFMSRSDSGAGAEDQGLSLNEFDEDRDHDRRGELAETDTLGRPWGFEDNKDDGAAERRGEEEEEGATLKEKEKKLGCFFFFFFFFFVCFVFSLFN